MSKTPTADEDLFQMAKLLHKTISKPIEKISTSKSLLTMVEEECISMLQNSKNDREEEINVIKKWATAVQQCDDVTNSITTELELKLKELSICISKAQSINSTHENIKRRRLQLEDDHRTATTDSFKQLRSDIEDIFTACMKGIQKVYLLVKM